jgi:hypothetical protein
MPKAVLPQELLSKASLQGNEYAWRIADVAEVIAAARDLGLATLGGQIQFRTPDGICELYWLSADADERRPGEDWLAFVARSADQVLWLFTRLVADTDFIAEGVRTFSYRAELRSRGHELNEYLYFAMSFVDQSGESQLRQMREELKARTIKRRCRKG